MSVCLFSVSQQLYQLRNWSGGVPLTPELEEGKLFLFTLTSCCHRNTAGSWPSSLHSTLSPPETRPAATANYHSIGENENAIKHHRRASWPALAKSLLWFRKKGEETKDYGSGEFPFLGNLFRSEASRRSTGSSDPQWNVDSFIPTEQIYRVTSGEAPGRHSSDELNRVIIFLTLPDAQAHIHSQSAET